MTSIRRRRKIAHKSQTKKKRHSAKTKRPWHVILAEADSATHSSRIKEAVKASLDKSYKVGKGRGQLLEWALPHAKFHMLRAQAMSARV